jgi:hypothetical protein
MNQKAARITFWISTGVFCAMMAFSAFLYLTSPDIAQAFVHLGFPSYFRIELAVFKLAGICALLLPIVPRWLKEWAYAGFFITLISAFIAHVASGDGPDKFMAPVIFAGILAASYISFRKLKPF